MVTIHAISDRVITLGREGENLARQVVFDISDWRESYGDGVVSLIAQRSGDTEPYPCAVTVDGSSVTWLVTAADTARQGYGRCELRYAVGDALSKSETWRTYTADALGTPAPEPPEPQQAWVDKVLAAGQAAVNASVNSPKIGRNGNWFVWDFELGKYVDTGVSASGGVSAVSSVNGQTGEVMLTAGDVGAATAERVEQLAGEVGGKITAPATAAVGQTIVVKTVDEAGRPTEWEAARFDSKSEPELIESFVSTEDMEVFTRSEEPDGTPYAFNALFIECDIGQGNTTYNTLKFESNLLKNMSFANAVCQGRGVSIGVYLSPTKTVCIGYGGWRLTPYHGYEIRPMNEAKYTVFSAFPVGESIKSFTINFNSKVNARTTIKIYGVRS